MSKMDKSQKGGYWSLVRKDGKAHPLLGGMMFIGREECDVILRSASADKRHAVIFFDCSSDEIRIKDLNSSAGTYVNGMRIPEQSYVKLKHCDSLRFGYGADVFHIQKCNGVPVRSFLFKQDVASDAEEIFVRKPQDFKSCNQAVDTKLPTEKIPDEMTGKSEDAIQLQEADSLEDIKQDSPSDSAPPVQLRRKKHNLVTCSGINTGTFRRNGNDHSASHTAFSGNSAVEYSNHENTDVKDMHSALPNEDSNRPDILKNDLHCSNGQDKNQSLNDSSPAAMAFTVAFDNVTPKKKLSIKDNISKYAPKKTYVAERVVTRPKSEKTIEPVIKKVMCQETNTSNKLETKSSPEESTLEDLEDGWKMVNKFENMKNKERQLSDGATYLIRKMFNGHNKLSAEQTAKPSSLKESHGSFTFENLPDKTVEETPKLSSSSPVKDEKVQSDDNKSETGTYTILVDVDDAAVKEAREKIDEVFNVMIPEETQGKEMPPPNQNVSVKRCNKEVASSDGESKQINSALDADTNCKSGNSLGSGVPIRPKRRLPVPPVQMTSAAPDFPLDAHRSKLFNYGTYSVKNRDSLMNQMSKSDIMLRDHSSGERSPLTKESISSNSQTSRFIPQSRFTLNDLQLNKLQNFHSSNELGHDHNFQLQTPVGGHWRRSPWNLSGSDLDLDQMKVETASVLSDVSASTEPTSLNSGKKSEHGPLMKFNRAFNLRRARLGLDAETAAPKSNSFKDSCLKTKNTHLNPPAPSLSRQDGGRFSLRLPKSAKPGNNKPVAKTIVNKPVANTVSKSGHRRNESDPGKTGFLRKGDGMRSDPEKRGPVNSSLLRSSSFSSDIDGDDDTTRRFVKKSNAPRPFSRQDTVTVEKSFDNKQAFINFHQEGKAHANNSKDVEKCFNNVYEKESRGACETSRNDDIKDGSPVIKNRNNDSKQLYPVSPFQKQKRELSALDSLVISAILQLSNKLRQKAHVLLEKERNKFPLDSTERLTIEEMLPQVLENRSGDTVSEGVSRDLSSILKNLKRVEQSLEVLAAVGEDQPKEQNKTPASAETGFFVVDV